jgi:hypothetical protein
MTDDFSSQMNNAREAISRGDQKTAQQILAAIISKDKDNADAWFLLAGVLDNPVHRIESLRRVLQINPNHITAKKQLDELTANYVQKDDRRQVVPSKTPDTFTRTPTKKRKTSSIILGLMFLAACVVVILIAIVVINSNSLPPHTVNDYYFDNGNVIDYYIVVDKSFSKDDAMKLINYYEGQNSGYYVLNVIFFCDKTYATEKIIHQSSVSENEYYAHVLYWYQTGTPGTKFLNDITNPDLANYPTLGSACR